MRKLYCTATSAIVKKLQTFVNLFGFWMLEIPVAYLLALHTRLHSSGAFLSIVIAESAMAIASIILFKRGRWKRQKI